MPPQQDKKGVLFGLSLGCVIALAVGIFGVMILGVMAALGIYGTRRYLAASKTSEAKNTVGAISRGATAAYEREVIGAGLSETAAPSHELCKSAVPVPGSLGQVKGRKYQPDTASGTDFETGSPTEGWQCLKFGMTQPHYYQYHYNQGSGYVAAKNPAVPSGKGYEAAAKGDIDGDGMASTFARTGEVKASGKLVSGTTIYIEDEFE